METCPRCHAQAWDESREKAWLSVRFAEGLYDLPVVHYVRTCRNCSFSYLDERATTEHASVVSMWKTSALCAYTDRPQSFCVRCGRFDPTEKYIELGLFDPEENVWDDSPEGEEGKWECCRALVFGCRLTLSVTH